MEFEVVWGENLLGFELENGVNGGGEEEEEAEQQRERIERIGGSRQVREKRGSRTMTKMPFPFSFVYFWSRLNRFCYR